MMSHQRRRSRRPDSGRVRRLVSERLERRDLLAFSVAAFESTDAGFVAYFDGVLDSNTLNLYDDQLSSLGPSDVEFVGEQTGPVAGSVVVDRLSRSATFVKSEGVLVPDTYHVTLRSGASGFVDISESQLDGDNDGSAGDDFGASFTVLPQVDDPLVIGIPDFVRGPWQPVNVPADSEAGLPVTVSEADNLRSAELLLSYDPGLLELTGATAAPGLPSGVTVTLEHQGAGLARLSFASLSALPSGSQTLANLQAEVPASASEWYSAQQVVYVDPIEIRDAAGQTIETVGDDAVHLNAYPGDVSGNGTINASDASRVAAVAAQLQSGFSASWLIDPILIGDITSNGRLNARDASAIAQHAALFEVDDIPAVPNPANSPPAPKYSYENAAPLPLPDPDHVVSVESAPELINAVRGLQSGRTILLMPGTYNLQGLTNALGVPEGSSNWAIRGATGSYEDVTISGGNMHGSVRFGIWTNSPNGVVADLTIRDISEHGVIANYGAHDMLYHGLRIVDIGDQFIKSNPTAFAQGNDRGVVAYSVFEYTTDEDGAGSLPNYSNAVDVHGGDDWHIHHNLFRNNLYRPGSGVGGPAILMWSGSVDTTVENNTFINNSRGVSYGLIDEAAGFDHRGGVIRNNFFYQTPGLPNRLDVAIFVGDSPDTRVYHNTVLTSGSYPNAIEYRFASSTNIDIRNNLTDASITARNGASGTVASNVTSATPSLFVDAASGDLHLKSGASVINQGVVITDATTDIDGELRDSLPDIGADEVLAGTQEAQADAVTCDSMCTAFPGESVPNRFANANEGVGLSEVTLHSSQLVTAAVSRDGRFDRPRAAQLASEPERRSISTQLDLERFVAATDAVLTSLLDDDLPF